MRQPLAHEVNQLAVGRRRAGLQHDEGLGSLAPLLVLHSHHADLLHGRVAHQHAFHFDRRDVLAAADDHVLEPVADFRVAVGVYDRGIAAVKPPAAHGLLRRLRIIVVPLHDDIAAHADLAECLAVVRDLVQGVIQHAQIAGCDQLHSLARLDHAALLEAQRLVVRPRLAHRDERRGFGQAIHLGHVPPELTLHPLDRRSGRRRPRSDDAHSPRRAISHGLRRVRQGDQDSRRRAKRRDRLLLDQLKRQCRVDLAQAHVRGANGGDDPHERPAVGVEHRQRPQIAIGRRHRQVNQRADDVHVGVPVRDHHALGPRCRSARVVDRQQVALAYRCRLEIGRRGVHHPLVFDPPRARPLERHEMLNPFQLAADAVYRPEIVRVRTNDARPRVIDDEGEIIRCQAVVDRYQHRTDLRHCIKRLQLRVRIRRNVDDPVALLHAECLQRRRPPIAPVEELLVGQALLTVDDRFAARVQTPRAPRELERCERNLHP